MQLPQWLARFNRYVTNPIQRIWAGFAPTFGILEHVGRLKNLTAAGGGRLKRYGRTFEVSEPRLVTKSEAAQHVTGPGRLVFPRLPFDNGAVLLRRV